MRGASSRIYPNLAISAASFLLAILLAEAILHLFPSPPFETWGTELFCKDKLLRRIMRPHARGFQLGREWSDVEIAANSEGYRDTEWDEKTGRVKIMLLGDSMGFGWGCRFEKTLGQILDQSDEFAVYNLCIPGDGFKDYYYRYAVYERTIHPDVVIILAYVNDLFDRKVFSNPPKLASLKAIVRQNAGPNGHYVPACTPYLRRDLKAFLNMSYLYRLVNKVRVSGGITFSSEERRRRLLRMGFADDIHFLRNRGAKLREPLRYLFQILQEIKRDGVQPIIVYIPPRYAIVDEALRELKSLFGSEANGFDPQIPDVKLRVLCERADVPYLSLTDVFENSEQSLYFKFDSHINERGHAVAAQALQAFLFELGF